MLVYGIGGGVLGFGSSFFLASSLGHSSESAGTIVPTATAAGGSILTYLFIRAGRGQDRREAIDRIGIQRREEKLTGIQEKEKSSKELLQELEREKSQQEELRKQREQILKQLEKN